MKKLFRSISILMVISMLVSAMAIVNVSAAGTTGVDFAEDFASWGWAINDPHNVADVATVSKGITVDSTDENIKAVVNGDMDFQIYGGAGKINFDINGAETGTVKVNLRVKPGMSAGTGYLWINSTNASSEPVSNKLFRISNTNPYMMLGETSPIVVKNSWGTSDAGAKAKDENGYLPIEIVFERRSTNFDWSIKVYNKAYSTTEPVVIGKAPKADYPVIESLSIDTAAGSYIYFDKYNVKNQPAGIDFTEDFSTWGWTSNTNNYVEELNNVDTNLSVNSADSSVKVYMVTSSNDLQIGGGAGEINFYAGDAEAGKVTLNLRYKPAMGSTAGDVHLTSSKEGVRNAMFRMPASGYAIGGPNGSTTALGIQYSWGTGAVGTTAKDSESYVPVEVVFERRNTKLDWDIKVYNKAYSTTSPVATGKAPKDDYPIIKGLSVDVAAGSWLYLDSYSVKYEPAGVDFAENFSGWGWTVNTGYSVAEFVNEDTNISVDTTEDMKAYIDGSGDLQIYGGEGYINLNVGGITSGKVAVNLRVNPRMASPAGNVYITSQNDVSNPIFAIPPSGYAIGGASVDTSALNVKYNWGPNAIGTTAKDGNYVPIEIVFERPNENYDWDIKVYNKAYLTAVPVITAVAPKADYPTIEALSVYTKSGSVLQIDSYSIATVPTYISRLVLNDGASINLTNYTGNLKYLLNVSTNVSAKVIVALYDGNILENVEIHELEDADKLELEGTFKNTNLTDGNVKAFLWDGFDNIVPLDTECLSFK